MSFCFHEKNRMFCKLCKGGKICDTLQFYYEWKHIIDIHYDNEYAFRWSCKNGYLDLVKWLWKISDEKIDIHADNEYAFRWSCKNGYLDVAKWLLELFFDEKYHNERLDIYGYTKYINAMRNRNTRVINKNK